MHLNNFGNYTWICAHVNDLTLGDQYNSCDQYNSFKIVAVKKTVWFGSDKFKNIILKISKFSEFQRLESRLFHSIIVSTTYCPLIHQWWESMVLWVGRGFANFVLAQIPQDCHPAHSPFIWLYMTWRNMRWIIVKIKISFVMKCACVCMWYMYLCEWGCLLNTWCEIYYLSFF